MTSLRLGALVVAIVPLGLLLVASQLEPNSRGLGTHQQLGLPPCSMRLIFGMRCPSCGMTTSWAHFTKGQWQQSFQVNAGGFLLAGFSILLAPVALRSAWVAELPAPKIQQWTIFVAIGIGAVTMFDWIMRLSV